MRLKNPTTNSPSQSRETVPLSCIRGSVEDGTLNSGRKRNVREYICIPVRFRGREENLQQTLAAMESERGVTGFRSTQDNLEKVNRTHKEEYIHLVYMKEMEERQHVDFIERSTYTKLMCYRQMYKLYCKQTIECQCVLPQCNLSMQSLAKPRSSLPGEKIKNLKISENIRKMHC